MSYLCKLLRCVFQTSVGFLKLCFGFCAECIDVLVFTFKCSWQYKIISDKEEESEEKISITKREDEKGSEGRDDGVDSVPNILFDLESQIPKNEQEDDDPKVNYSMMSQLAAAIAGDGLDPCLD